MSDRIKKGSQLGTRAKSGKLKPRAAQSTDPSRPPVHDTASIHAKLAPAESYPQAPLPAGDTSIPPYPARPQEIAPPQVNAPPQEIDEAFVIRLYNEMLGRIPDIEGMTNHLNGLKLGMTREQLVTVFLDSGELKTVPNDPTYHVPISQTSPTAAIVDAATWVKVNHPEFFNQGEARPVAYRMMTLVIGILRANGFDAHRVVNYPDRPVPDPGRYGKDALVLNGTIYDVYRAWGDPGAGEPQALAVGTYGNRPRE